MDNKPLQLGLYAPASLCVYWTERRSVGRSREGMRDNKPVASKRNGGSETRGGNPELNRARLRLSSGIQFTVETVRPNAYISNC